MPEQTTIPAQLDAWAAVWRGIQRQHESVWLLKDGPTPEEAERAIDRAYELADELRNLADALEVELDMAGELLPE